LREQKKFPREKNKGDETASWTPNERVGEESESGVIGGRKLGNQIVPLAGGRKTLDTHKRRFT